MINMRSRFRLSYRTELERRPTKLMAFKFPRTKTADGTAFIRTGNGSPVVLIHGVGLRAESWYPQIEVLESEHTVFAVDLPGHGESDQLESSLPTLQEYSDRIVMFIENNVNGAPIVIGHSMGALIALDITTRYPQRCVGLAALNAIFRRTAAARAAVLNRADTIAESGVQAVIDATIDRWFPADEATDGVIVSLCRGWLGATNADGYATAYRVFATEDGPPEHTLAGINVPTLFMTGEHDYNSAASMSLTLAQRVKNSEAVVIPGARHMSHLTHPAETNAALKSLITISGGKEP